MKEQFENKIKENIKEFSIQPADEVWLGISNALNQQKKRKAFAWWLPVTIFLVVVIAVSVYFKTTIQTNYIYNTKPQENNSKPNYFSNKKQVAIEHNNISTLFNVKIKSPKLTRNFSKAKQIQAPPISVDGKKNTGNKINDNSNHINNGIIESDNVSAIIHKSKGLLAHDSLNELLNTLQPVFKFKSVLFKDSLNNLMIATTKNHNKKLNLFYVGEIGLFTEKSNNLSDENLIMQDAFGGLSGTIPNLSQNAALITLPKTGITFKIGVLVEKQISNRLSVNTGIYYRFISNKQYVNAKVDSAQTVLYTLGNKRLKTNIIHAFGIPILLNYKFKLNRDCNIMLGAGGALQLLAYKKWLIPDTNFRAYTYNKNYPLSFQLNGNIMAGLEFKNNLRIMATISMPFNNFYNTQLSSRTFLQSGLQVSYPLSLGK
jgi:hypothetical protein